MTNRDFAKKSLTYDARLYTIRRACRNFQQMAIPYLRSVTTPDLPVVLEIQSRCYGQAFHEPLAAFQAKLSESGSAWLAWVDDVPAGYLFTLTLALTDTLALPSLADTTVPGLDNNNHPNCLYLHDLAVLPEHRGSGISRLLFAAALEHATAMRLSHMALVAVQGSLPFWQSLGFQPVPTPPPSIQTKLASYGEGAAFMLRSMPDCEQTLRHIKSYD